VLIATLFSTQVMGQQTQAQRTPGSRPSAERGKQIFSEYCAACHGGSGKQATSVQHAIATGCVRKFSRIWDGRYTEYGQQTGLKAGITRSKDFSGILKSCWANDPLYRKQIEHDNKTQSLRQQLVDFREIMLKPVFPDSPSEEGLLRETLLDEFVAKRPKMKDEWFRKVSHDLRANTDPGQVGKFLIGVLEIVAEFD
jgi:hypothetical protein